MKKWGAIDSRDTIAAINGLVDEHGVDWGDKPALQDLDGHEVIFKLVDLSEVQGADDQQLIVLITSPTWLTNAAYASTCGYHFGMHVDGTHGLVLEEAQLILIGTHDIQQHGHRIAAAIVPKAGFNTELMTAIFKELRNCVELMLIARVGDDLCPPG